MKSLRNQYGKISHNEILDECENCGKMRCRHTTLEAIMCKRALANSV